MEYYDYSEWIEWPESDIREYVREIAADCSLTANETNHLERQMTQRANYWPKWRKRIGPKKLNAEGEALYRSMGKGGDDIFTENVRMNSPYVPPNFDLEVRWEVIGSGLTRKHSRQIIRESPASKRERQRERRKIAKRPFTTMNSHIQGRAEDAMWFANCYPIGYGAWLIPRGNDAPYEGMVWYSRELLSAFHNARHQAQLGNDEAAMWHAFRAGELCTELEMRIAHGRTFEKYEAVRMAQQDAARSRKSVSDETRRDTYWRYRQEGNKRVEAGRLAASELGLSEASIRNAFPDARYPTE